MSEISRPPRRDVATRFWAKVNKSGPMRPGLGRCWVWERGLQTSGYGNAWIDGTSRTAHKVAWVWKNGPVPDGLQLDHLCGNRACCRPSHLEPVTSRENSARSTTSVNAINSAKTCCPNGHPFDGVDSYGRRYCRRCRREYGRQRARRAA